MDVFFHCYLKYDYGKILLNKFKKMKISGLYEKLNTIHVMLSGNVEDHETFLKEVKSLYPKIEYIVVKDPLFNNEPDTLNYMIMKANEYSTNTPMLYMHTKGITHIDPTLRKNIDAWVRYLDLYTISKWEECVNALDTNDVAGGLYADNPMKHFSGNFWWANSDYIKKLPKLNKVNILPLERGEFWICSKTDKIHVVAENAPVDLYMNYYCIPSDFPDGF